MEVSESQAVQDLVDDVQDRSFVRDDDKFTEIEADQAHTLNFLDVPLQNYRQVTVVVQLENILEPEHTFRRLRTEHVDTLVAEFKEKGYLESVGLLSVAITEGKGDANAGKWNELRGVLDEGRGTELPGSVRVCLIDGRHRLRAMKVLTKTSEVWKKRLAGLPVKLWTPNSGIATSRAELLSLSGALNRASSTVGAPTFEDHVHAAVSLASVLRARPGIGQRLSANFLACALSKGMALGRMGPRQTLRYAQVALKLSDSTRNFDSFVAVSKSCKKLSLVHLCNDYLLKETTDEQFSLCLEAVAGKVDVGLEQPFHSFGTQFYAMLRLLLKEVSFAAERMRLSFSDVLKMEAPVQRFRVKIAKLIVRIMTKYRVQCYRPEPDHCIRLQKFQAKLIDAVGIDYRVSRELSSQECTAKKSSIQKKRLTIPRRRISNTPPRLARARTLTKNASSRRPGLDDFDSLGDSDSSATEKDHLDSDTERGSSHPEKKRKVVSGDLERRAKGTDDEDHSNALQIPPVTPPPPGREENAFKALPDSTVSPPKKRKVVSGDLYRCAKETKDKDHSEALQIPRVTYRLSTRQRQVSKDFEKDNPKKHNVEVESSDEAEFEDVLPNILPVGVNEPEPYVARGKDGRWVRHAVSPPSKWGRKNPITHATPFLDAIFIPHEHRANVMLSDPSILRANHHMVFWRAAYNHHATSAWEEADTRHTWKRAFMEDEASLTYFGRRREQILQRGYAILEGFLADESVPADLVKNFPIEGRNFFLPLHNAVQNSFHNFSNKGGNEHDWNSVGFEACMIDSPGAKQGIGRYQSTLHSVTTAIEEDANLVWMCASRSLLDARISQCIAALGLWTNTEKIGHEDIHLRPSMYTPKTGGRWLVASRGCLRQQLHTDFEVQCRLNGEEALLVDEAKQNPGFFTVTTAGNAVVLWLCPFSHYLVATAEEKSLQALSRSLKAVKVIIPPFSIFVGRGDMFHAGAAFEDYDTDSESLRYRLYFVPENRKLTDQVYLQRLFNPEFKVYKENGEEEDEKDEGLRPDFVARGSAFQVPELHSSLPSPLPTPPLS